MRTEQFVVKSEEPAFWFVVSQGKLLLREQEIPIPQGRWQDLALPEPDAILPLGQWQQLPCYLLISEDQQVPHERWGSARDLLHLADQTIFELAARACQLALFMQTHRYCGQCGSRMDRVSWELAMLCHRCGHRCYPRISPCILVAIIKDHQILLARSKRHKAGFYSILAGFVESGETLEQAAIREVKEEVGVDIKHLRYVGSQPWPFPHSLMAGFIADYQGGEIHCQVDEIEEAHWFDINALPEVPPLQTLSGRMISQVQQLIQEKGNKKATDVA